MLLRFHHGNVTKVNVMDISYVCGNVARAHPFDELLSKTKSVLFVETGEVPFRNREGSLWSKLRERARTYLTNVSTRFFSHPQDENETKVSLVWLEHGKNFSWRHLD